MFLLLTFCCFCLLVDDDVISNGGNVFKYERSSTSGTFAYASSILPNDVKSSDYFGQNALIATNDWVLIGSRDADPSRTGLC